MKLRSVAPYGLLLFAFVSTASADVIGLFESGHFNVDGFVYTAAPVPGLNEAAFDRTTGLGTLTMTYAPGVAGAYRILAFFDHEIDEIVNTFFNEFGAAVGAPPAGLSWEIDEPGVVFGDIYTNFLAGVLDNSAVTGPEDNSMAIGWNMILAADEYAVITYRLGTTAPASGFYLHQWDPESTVSPYDVYLSSSIVIRTATVPEPGSVTLLATVLLGLLCGARKMARK